MKSFSPEVIARPEGAVRVRPERKRALPRAQERFRTMQRPMRKNVTALTAALLAALALAACGDEPKDSRDSASKPAPSEDTVATETNPQEPSTPTEGGTISKNLKQKPEIPKPAGSPPPKLEVKEIVKGK